MWNRPIKEKVPMCGKKNVPLMWCIGLLVVVVVVACWWALPVAKFVGEDVPASRAAKASPSEAQCDVSQGESNPASVVDEAEDVASQLSRTSLIPEYKVSIQEEESTQESVGKEKPKPKLLPVSFFQQNGHFWDWDDPRFEITKIGGFTLGSTEYDDLLKEKGKIDERGRKREDGTYEITYLTRKGYVGAWGETLFKSYGAELQETITSRKLISVRFDRSWTYKEENDWLVIRKCFEDNFTILQNEFRIPDSAYENNAVKYLGKDDDHHMSYTVSNGKYRIELAAYVTQPGTWVNMQLVVTDLEMENLAQQELDDLKAKEPDGILHKYVEK